MRHRPDFRRRARAAIFLTLARGTFVRAQEVASAETVYRGRCFGRGDHE
jgi:hypothetical protein